MIIIGIRHKINSELDAHKSACLARYLIYFLQMFALLGIIVPILIGVDYYCIPLAKEETVTNKYYDPTYASNIIYYVYTDSYHFSSDAIFYENTNKGDKLTLYSTPIFNVVTTVTNVRKSEMYTSKVSNVYGWPLIIAGPTFIISVIVMIKIQSWMKKREYVKYDSVVNIGVVNAFLCLMTLVAILFI